MRQNRNRIWESRKASPEQCRRDARPQRKSGFISTKGRILS